MSSGYGTDPKPVEHPGPWPTACRLRPYPHAITVRGDEIVVELLPPEGDG